MSNLSDENLKKLSKARYQMHGRHPFFAQIATHLHPVKCEFIPTAGVDANGTLYVNEKFLDKLNDSDVFWLLAHEAMHIVTMTHGRMPEGANKMVFNVASDCSINMLVTDDAGIQIINPSVCQPIYGGQWAKYKGATTEAIYYDIMQDPEKMLGVSLDELEGMNGEVGEGASSGGVNRGNLKGKWWDDSASRLGKPGQPKQDAQGGTESANGGMTEEQKAQWKQRIASAKAAAKAAGKLSGALEEYLTDILAAKKDWRNELRMMAKTALRQRWTWRIPGRRNHQVRMPGKERGVPTAICYIDTSGSQSDADIQRCLSETAAIFKMCGGKGHLILGDSVIYFSGDMDVQKLSHLPEVRRGGTDFCVLFQHIEETFKKEPAILVGFTDLCGPFPEAPPSYPVIWCVPDSGSTWKGKAPWGRVIEVDV